MVRKFDDALHVLSQVDDHQALAGLEERVLADIEARRSDDVGMRMMLGLAVGALLIGAASSSIPVRSVAASETTSFVGPGPLAPSSLLLRAGER